jgi:hypothetical protein
MPKLTAEKPISYLGLPPCLLIFEPRGYFIDYLASTSQLDLTAVEYTACTLIWIILR